MEISHSNPNLHAVDQAIEDAFGSGRPSEPVTAERSVRRWIAAGATVCAVGAALLVRARRR